MGQRAVGPQTNTLNTYAAQAERSYEFGLSSDLRGRFVNRNRILMVLEEGDHRLEFRHGEVREGGVLGVQGAVEKLELSRVVVVAQAHQFLFQRGVNRMDVRS